MATDIITAAPDENATSMADEDSRFWNTLLAPYKKPDHARSILQLVSSLALFAGLWSIMLWSLQFGYGWTLLLAVPAAGMLVRLFIIQHDCGHGSFFRSRLANDRVGSLLGIMTLTPYHYWRRTHSIHHATSGNLDGRGFGDVDTLTVKEYQALGAWQRFWYRVYRNPFVLFVIGPPYQFLLKHRFPWDTPRTWKKEWSSIVFTNLALVGLLFTMWYAIGLGRFFLVQLPITLISGAIGVWLFYVQHQFEETYWERRSNWNFYRASIQGSSFYVLPRVLHWFTGNIGFHHVHHLASLIPNYRLRQCMEENVELQKVTRLTPWQSLGCARLKLWDEDRARLIRFSDLRAQSH